MKFYILLLCLMASQIKAQVLFDQGISGFDLGVQVTSTKVSTLVGISPSYTVNGKVSFGITLASESLKDFDLNSTAVRPFLSYLAVRQSDELPLNVTTFAAYQYNTFSDLDITANSFDLGIGISHKIEGKVKIFPTGSVRWNKTTYSQLLSDYTGISYSLYLTMLFADKFYVEPALRFQNGDSVFSLFLGLLISP